MVTIAGITTLVLFTTTAAMMGALIFHGRHRPVDISADAQRSELQTIAKYIFVLMAAWCAAALNSLFIYAIVAVNLWIIRRIHIMISSGGNDPDRAPRQRKMLHYYCVVAGMPLLLVILPVMGAALQ